MTRIAAWLVVLTATYLLVLGSLHPLDLATGVLLSVVALAGGHRFVWVGSGLSARALAARIVAFAPLVGAVGRDVVRGTWEVALVVVGARPIPSPGIVAVPIGERTPTGVAVSALATTLSPGAFLVDIDDERRVMLIHVLDATDPDAVRREHEDFYRRYQRRVFP